MPSIVHGGMRYTQTKHAIQCIKCLEIIESKHSGDFKYCSCKAVGIDGGISSGNRILGNLSDIEYRSMYCALVKKRKIWLPQFAIEEHFKGIHPTASPLTPCCSLEIPENKSEFPLQKGDIVGESPPT